MWTSLDVCSSNSFSAARTFSHGIPWESTVHVCTYRTYTGSPGTDQVPFACMDLGSSLPGFLGDPLHCLCIATLATRRRLLKLRSQAYILSLIQRVHLALFENMFRSKGVCLDCFFRSNIKRSSSHQILIVLSTLIDMYQDDLSASHHNTIP